MKFKFKIQQYQTEAVDATVNVFAGQPLKTNAHVVTFDGGKVAPVARLLASPDN